MAAPPAIVPPRATYRLQLWAEFPCEKASAISDYLAELGVSHIYASPFLQAAPGSTHGYDVTDPTRVSQDLGGVEACNRLCLNLEKNNLGLVLDIVPNHMDIESPDNVWWADVLRNGRASRFASFFDIDWNSPNEKLREKVLIPILGDHFGRVIEKGEVKIERTGTDFFVRYYERTLPVAPETLDRVFERAADTAQSDLLAFVADALADSADMPFASGKQRLRRERRHRVLLSLVRQLLEMPDVVQAIDAAVHELNRDPDALEKFLDRQHYRLAWWRTGDTELNYRRFFNITNLAGLRVEDENVFQQSHALILGWVRDGRIDGLRIDHPDGLRKPQQYLARLRTAAPKTWIVVEKILDLHEPLPTAWPVQGTTGYDFMNRVAALFVDPEAEQPLTDFYGEFTLEPTSYIAVLREKKQLILQRTFGAELDRLANLLSNICERHRRHRDYARSELLDAIRELVVAFPVYRSYVRPETGEISQTDANYIRAAVETAKVFRSDLDAELFDFILDILTLRRHGQQEEDFVLRFQQFTGPVMAKGAEDTAFYCYNRLISLNEVGGDPGRFGMSTEEFHQVCREMQHDWPTTMLATSTHDSKRSEDVRARINLITEMPYQWLEAVERWARINQQHKRSGVPDRNTEYFLYQTLMGAWPIETERVLASMEKATREAKLRTSWKDPNPMYDERFKEFLTDILRDPEFIKDLETFVEPLVEPGRISSLAQVLIKFTAPGVPDIYQGNEIWNLVLVDPDNRRPVDYDLRRALLSRLDGMSPAQVMQNMDHGLPKLFLTQRALKLRAKMPYAFAEKASYAPIETSGEKAGHLVAFQRSDRVITAVPRLIIKLNGDWKNTAITLPPGSWKNEFTGEIYQAANLPAAILFKNFPVALLVKETP